MSQRVQNCRMAMRLSYGEHAHCIGQISTCQIEYNLCVGISLCSTLLGLYVQVTIM